MTNLHTRSLFQIGRSSLIEFEMFELHRIEIFYFIVFCPGFLQVAELPWVFLGFSFLSLFIYFGPNQSASDGFPVRLPGPLPEFSASAQIINPIYLQTSELPGKVFANYFLAVIKIMLFENKLVCLLLKCIATPPSNSRCL